MIEHVRHGDHNTNGVIFASGGGAVCKDNTVNINVTVIVVDDLTKAQKIARTEKIKQAVSNTLNRFMGRKCRGEVRIQDVAGGEVGECGRLERTRD